jgi:arylsulfatase A-like enzyme
MATTAPSPVTRTTSAALPSTRRGQLPLLGALCAALAGCGAATGPRENAPRHVILISLDTLRASRCGMFGHPQPTTPFLDSLAGQGVLFESHMVNSNNTLSSHASILTGLVPLAHGTFDSGEEGGRRALAPTYRTLASEFRAAGFDTAAFTAHPIWLGREFGLGKGFDVLETDWVDAPANTLRFLRWYDREAPERMFVLLHYYDLHSDTEARGATLPYESDPELVERFAGPKPEGFTGCASDPPDWCTSRYLQAISMGLEPLPPEHLRYVSGLYDAGLRKLDADLSELFRQMRRRGLLENALVVITSDHGEAFLEHGHMLHDTFHEEIMHVPLIVLPPPAWRVQPRRVGELTRSIDLAPTLLELAGLRPIGQGQSLAPALLQGARIPHEEVFFGPAVLRSRDEVSEFKFNGIPGAEAFYDLGDDPGEQRDLCAAEPIPSEARERIERARARVEELREKAIALQLQIGGESGLAPDLDERTIQELRRLGYLR